MKSKKHSYNKPERSHRPHGKDPALSSKKLRTHDKKPVEGILSVNARGTGYVRILSEKDQDVEIAHNDLQTALHGDIVLVKILGKNREGKRTGKIDNIIRRAKVGFSGTLALEDGRYVLVPSDTRMYTTIEINKKNLLDAKVGEKVFVIITSWKDSSQKPEGKIEKVLGKEGENNAEMLGIALEKGFSEDFPAPVLRAAEDLKKEGIPESEIKARRDFRKITTFTIDPSDAKDFDDALSFQTLSNGNVEVGIHIADVSHYVQINSILDKEAEKRGTSVYLVDRTIPMLPEVLSNDLCSLKPNEDKLTMSAVFELDKKARVIKKWFGKTIIHSDKRFTYEEAEVILKEKKGLYKDELLALNTLAKELMKERFRNGALSLDQDEVKFELDDKGVPIRVYRKVRGDSNRLIEEFMLLANRKVAEEIGMPDGKQATKENEQVFVYRIHDLPDKEKMADLAEYLKKLGHKVSLKNGIIPSHELNALIVSLEGHEEKSSIQTAIVRSMAKAIYSTKNIGHYGLGFENYTHFTSPIRRYPDVIVHRLLESYSHNKKVPRQDWNKFEEISIMSSEREKEAAEAERASIKYKQVEYMSSRIGEVFDGVVTGVSEWGIYAEDKETKCEGMIKLKDLGSDFFVLDKKGMQVIGQKTKKTYRIGDQVKIKVMNADMKRKIIDYALA